ncbi:MAG: alpha/beta fold hydrolase, partial [Nodosilinea sp.]
GGPPLAQILYIPSPGDPDLDAIEQSFNPLLLALLQELAVQPIAAAQAKLWLISQGMQAIAPQDAVTNLPQAMLWGLGRTLRLEHPEFWGGLVDFPGITTDLALTTQTLVTHILAADGEDEAAIRQGQRWVPRLQTLSLPPHESAPLQASATYVITGGTGALGQQLTQWLVDRGARHLVLLSRRGSHSDLDAALATLRSQGAEIWVEAVDVADADALAQLLTRVQQQLPPIKGIFHAAGVLADGFLINQTPEQFYRVMPAKLQGAWNLHQLTQDLELDWFVLFSSIAALLGSPGQGNYSAANAGLDALAHYRQQQGLAALSLAWGPWQGAGMAVDQQPAAEVWSQRGMAPLAVEDGLRWLTVLLDQPLSTPHLGIADIDWSRLQRYLPTVPPVLSAMATAITQPQRLENSQVRAEASAPALLQRLLWLNEGDRVTELVTYFQTQVAQVMGLSGPVPLDRPLLDLGIDSLMTMDLLALCRQDLQLVLYPREVMAHPTVADLAQYVASELVRLHQPQATDPSAEEAVASPEPPDFKLPSHPWQAVAPLDPLPSQPNDSMIFLLSAPRSGSTLLRVMLAGHPDLFCPPELHLLPFNTLADQQTALGGSYLQEGLQRALMELWQIDADQAEALLSDWSQHQLTVPEIYGKMQQTAAPRQLVDKSPTYSFGLETLERAEQIFAGAKYIHLVRHPYAVIDSFVRNRMHKIFDITPADPYQLAEQVWQTSNHNIATFLNRVAPTRHHLLRYEDLVADPAPAMKALCAFLDLPFDPAVLTPYQGRRMTDGVRAKSLAVDDPNFRQRDQIDPGLATVWQSMQLPRQLNSTSQTLAQQFDYPLPQEGEPVLEQAQRSTPPAPLPPDYVPLAHLRQEHITLRGRESCICHWGPEQGPKVLCLHGILEHGAAWDAVADTLAQQGYHVIAPDLRGHGRSAHAGPDGGYQLMDFLGDMDSFTQALATQSPVVLVGHSMGAVLSAVLTSLRPERFSRLVLVEPVVPAAAKSEDTPSQLAAHLDYFAAPPDPVVIPSLAAAAQRIRALKPSLSDGAAQKLAERLTRQVPGGLCWRRDPRLQARTALSLGGGLVDRQGYGQLLQHIALPTTVVFGRHSQFNRPEDLAFLKENLSLAVPLTLPGGHDLPTETPVDLADIIHRAIEKEHL